MGSRDLLVRPDVIVAKSARLRKELHRLADDADRERPFGRISDTAERLQAVLITKRADGLTSHRQIFLTLVHKNMALNLGSVGSDAGL